MAQTTDTKAGRALRRWATKEKLGPREVARRLGADPGQMWRIMHGERKPALPLAFHIEDTLGIPARGWIR